MSHRHELYAAFSDKYAPHKNHPHMPPSELDTAFDTDLKNLCLQYADEAESAAWRDAIYTLIDLKRKVDK